VGPAVDTGDQRAERAAPQVDTTSRGHHAAVDRDPGVRGVLVRGGVPSDMDADTCLGALACGVDPVHAGISMGSSGVPR